jgi:hypothetical protein
MFDACMKPFFITVLMGAAVDAWKSDIFLSLCLQREMLVGLVNFEKISQPPHSWPSLNGTMLPRHFRI